MKGFPAVGPSSANSKMFQRSTTEATRCAFAPLTAAPENNAADDIFSNSRLFIQAVLLATGMKRLPRKSPLTGLIYHKGGDLRQEFAKKLLRLARQRSFHEGIAHQCHPTVARCLIDVETGMAHAQARMPPLLNVALRAAEPADQEIAQPLLGAWQIVSRIHGT